MTRAYDPRFDPHPDPSVETLLSTLRVTTYRLARQGEAEPAIVSFRQALQAAVLAGPATVAR